MRPSFQPRLVNGPSGDPGLLVSLAFRNRALLFDLGHLDTLSSGDILKLSHIFVSHTHIDHFIGFDQVLRLLLGRPHTLHLFGPEGFLRNVSGKLQAYSWNLVQNYQEALVLYVTEISEKSLTTRRFDCHRRFRPGKTRVTPNNSGPILSEPELQVSAAILDHQIPCLAYVLEERFHINVIKARLDELGLEIGPWLSHLKELIYEGADPGLEIEAPRVDGKPARWRVGSLAERIISVTPGQKIGYVTDAVHNCANEEKILKLMKGCDRLFIEAAFLDEHREIARVKHHLTARQAGNLARKAQVQAITVFHHSPRYTGMNSLLQEEAQAAFEGRA